MAKAPASVKPSSAGSGVQRYHRKLKERSEQNTSQTQASVKASSPTKYDTKQALTTTLLSTPLTPSFEQVKHNKPVSVLYAVISRPDSSNSIQSRPPVSDLSISPKSTSSFASVHSSSSAASSMTGVLIGKSIQSYWPYF